MRHPLREDTATLCSRCGLALLAEDKPCVACSAPGALDTPERIGPYPVLSQIGASLHSRIFLCEDGSRDRVAVKLYDGGAPQTDRILREARLAARVRHTNVVQIRALGRTRGATFVASEHVRGWTLSDVLMRTGRLCERDALLILRGVARALSAANGIDLLHRNLKPNNVWVADDGEVKVSDFGRGAGAPYFVAPETRHGEAGDTRSDLHDLGSLLFLMLTGGEYRDIEGTPSARLAELRPDVHAIMFPLVDRLLANEPQGRFASPAELLMALDETLGTISLADAFRLGLADDAPYSVPEMVGVAGAGHVRAGAVATAVLFIGSAFLSTIGSPIAVEASVHRESPGTSASKSAGARAIPDTVALTGLVATFNYALGSAVAGDAFDTRTSAGIERVGGRLRVASGQPYLAIHQQPLEGDLEATLNFVLDPGGELALKLLTADGREVSLHLRSAAGHGQPGIELSNHNLRLAAVTERVEPKLPHLVGLRRDGRDLRVELDGKSVLRATAALSGSFRVGVLLPRGGGELRQLRVSGRLARAGTGRSAASYAAEYGSDRLNVPTQHVEVIEKQSLRTVHQSFLGPRMNFDQKAVRPGGNRGPSEW